MKVGVTVSIGVRQNRNPPVPAGMTSLPNSTPNMLVKGRSSLSGLTRPGFTCIRTKLTIPCLVSAQNVIARTTGTAMMRTPTIAYMSSSMAGRLLSIVLRRLQVKLVTTSS